MSNEIARSPLPAQQSDQQLSSSEPIPVTPFADNDSNKSNASFGPSGMQEPEDETQRLVDLSKQETNKVAVPDISEQETSEVTTFHISGQETNKVIKPDISEQETLITEATDATEQPTQELPVPSAEDQTEQQVHSSVEDVETPTQELPVPSVEASVPASVVETLTQQGIPTPFVETSTQTDQSTGIDQKSVGDQQAPPPSDPDGQSKKRKKHPLWLRVLLITLVVLVVLTSGGVAYAYYYFQQHLNNIIHVIPRSQTKHQRQSMPTTVTDTGTNVTGRNWNILLLGSDNDNKYVFPQVLTQVMMIIHIDTSTNKVSMVSIPRDSWVSVPDIGGMHKIDQAFLLGSSSKNKFDDGVQAARNTVEQDYGIPIDRYAWVGLDGYAKVIDTLGGVDVDVMHPITDDVYPDDTGKQINSNDPYALKRLYMAPGPQHLSGLQALEYVRSRHADLVGDIGRTQRQQQVLEALKKKLDATTIVQNLPQLFTDLNGSVYTDISEQEMLGFANYGRTLLKQPIDHLTLGPGDGKQNYGELQSIYDPSVGANQDVVIPHCENIQPIINKIFKLGDKRSCQVGSSG